MTQSYLKLLLGCLIFSVITGCGETPDSQDAQNPIQVPSGWKPEDVNLTCANPALCPDNQGILFSISKSETSYGYSRYLNLFMYRCTATLYQTDKVLTAGHCIEHMKDAQEIYFKTAEKPGSPSRTFRVKQPLGSKVDFSDLASADYGAFQLAEPATGIALAHPLTTEPTDAHEMLAFVVNPISEDSGTYTLDAVSCQHSATLDIPLNYAQNPTTFGVYDCKIYSGNSGGIVVLAKDPLSVLGVLHASNNAKDSSSRGDVEKIDRATATNARCFELPGWPRSEKDCIEITTPKLKPMLTSFVHQKSAESILAFAHDWLKTPAASLSIDDGVGSVQLAPKIMVLKYSYGYASVSSSKQNAILALPMPVCILRPWAGSKDFTIDALPTVSDINLNSRTLDVQLKSGSLQIPFRLAATYISGDQYRISYSFETKDNYAYSIELLKHGDVEPPQSESKDVTIPACKGSDAMRALENDTL